MEQNLIGFSNFNTLTNTNLEFISQIFLLVVIIFFSVFEFLVERQVKILNKTIRTPMGGMLNLLSSLELFAALLLLIVVIFLVLL